MELAIDDLFDMDGRDPGRDVGVAAEDGVRGRMPGVLGVCNDIDRLRSGARKFVGGFCVGVSGSESFVLTRPKDDGGRRRTASLKAWSISGSACLVALVGMLGPIDDRGRRIDGVGIPVAVGIPLLPGDPRDGRPGVANIGRRDIVVTCVACSRYS